MIKQQDTRRWIIHCDMDAFYASVEQLKNPELAGKPVVVGGNPNSRGVVSACSYEARKFGIRSAMPLAEAYRRCPRAVFLPVDFPKYKEASREMHKIFYDYTPMIEPIALDEAFLDVTGSLSLHGTAPEIGRKIKARIKSELGLTVSVGIAHNKFLAKLASDLSKPDGFMTVDPDNVQEFLDPLEVGRIWGIGEKTAYRLSGLNINTVYELRRLDEDFLVREFGVYGHQMFQLARGIDHRPVQTGRRIKSVGRETTFATDICGREALAEVLLELSADVGRSLRREGLKGRTITVKIKFSDFKTVTRSETVDGPTNIDDDIYRAACLALQKIAVRPVRLVGVSVHNLTDREEIQLSLFSESELEKTRLTEVLDLVKEKFGDKAITRAKLLE